MGLKYDFDENVGEEGHGKIRCHNALIDDGGTPIPYPVVRFIKRIDGEDHELEYRGSKKGTLPRISRQEVHDYFSQIEQNLK